MCTRKLPLYSMRPSLRKRFINKLLNSRPRGTNHFGQCALAHLQDGRIWLGLRTKACEQQERPCQPLLAGAEELIEEVFLNSDNARE